MRPASPSTIPISRDDDRPVGAGGRGEPAGGQQEREQAGRADRQPRHHEPERRHRVHDQLHDRPVEAQITTSATSIA